MPSVDVTMNHESISVREDDSYDILCEALGAEVKTCVIVTPYNERYGIYPGAK